MTVKEAILKAIEVAEETKIGSVGNIKDHNVIVKIAELILTYEL